jgi:15-cis-phytoene synthase
MMLQDDEVPLPMLARLMLGYAGKDRVWQEAVWRFDTRLAIIVLGAREPMLAQIKLAWWRDNLRAEGAGGRDPLLRALCDPAVRPNGAKEALIAMIDGWEASLVLPDGLTEHAEARGGGLFRAIGGEGASPVAGALWAIWDMAGRTNDPDIRGKALELGAAILRKNMEQQRLPRPLRLLSIVAQSDLERGRCAPGDMTLGLYLRIWRAHLLGR